MLYKKTVFILCLILCSSVLKAQDAKEIVRLSDQKMRGSSSETEITVKTIRPSWQREMTIKTWAKGNNYSLVMVIAPAKDRGNTFLKRGREVYNWVPAVERNIKLPPSMMSQSWMGTDFTNEDLIRESSIVEDYEHKIVGEETLEGLSCHKIELKAKPDAAVVWDKIYLWIDKKNYITLKSEYYDEEGFLVNTLKASQVKNLGGRMVPSYFEMIPADKKGNKTVMIYKSMEFDKPIPESFFTVQNMKMVQ